MATVSFRTFCGRLFPKRFVQEALTLKSRNLNIMMLRTKNLMKGITGTDMLVSGGALWHLTGKRSSTRRSFQLQNDHSHYQNFADQPAFYNLRPIAPGEVFLKRSSP
jgi:hypothetical protein